MMEYQIIYADPPWDSRKSGWGGYKHYPTMKTPDICALDVGSIAGDNAMLFIWTIGCHLDTAIKVIKSWGFNYKTIAFVWVKQYRNGVLYSGLGHWTKQGTEICLLATKGKPHRVSASVRQIILEPITIHSKKPTQTRERIIELCGDLPRIELFARQKINGWDCWGNEVESDIDLNTIKPMF